MEERGSETRRREVTKGKKHEKKGETEIKIKTDHNNIHDLTPFFLLRGNLYKKQTENQQITEVITTLEAVTVEEKR